MTFVLDSSVALAWCFEDEQTPEVIALLREVAELGAVVPSLWPLEVLNGLTMAERRRRLDGSRRRQMAALLRELPINVDPDTTFVAWTDTAALAERFRLTLYDAAYLELAIRKAVPIATLDEDLRRAAVTAGVRIKQTVR